MKKSRIIRNNQPSAKLLSAAALTGLFAFGAPASAVELVNVDLYQKSNNVPTLEYYKNINPEIPKMLPLGAPNIGVTTYIFKDNDGNVVKTFYQIRDEKIYKNLTLEQYNELLKSGDLYRYAEYSTNIYKPSDWGYETVEELIENNFKDYVFTDVNPKPAYDKYFESLENLNKEFFSFVSTGYTLTPVSEKTNNTITTYSVNKDTFELTPQEYRIDLEKLDYGNQNGDTTKYFEWSKNQYGNIELGEVATPTDGKVTISYSYNNIPETPVINNNGTITNDVVGNFIDNKGYAVSNSNGTITGNIIGSFVNNTTGIYGGTCNGDIIADFINNDTAIYWVDTNNIKGDFIGNKTALHGVSVNGNVSGNFIGNQYAVRNSRIDTITGNFVGNRIAISEGSANVIAANFINNTHIAISNGRFGYVFGDFYKNGGIVGNLSNIKYLAGNFIENTGGIYSTTIDSLNGNFIGNTNFSINSSDINSINANFYKNSGDDLITGYTLGDIKGDFIENEAATSIISAHEYVAYTGAIGNINSISGNFVNNKIIGENSSAHSIGVVVNEGILNNVSGRFIGNEITLKDGDVGAAIYSNRDLNITADNDISEFTNNIVKSANGEEEYIGVFIAPNSQPNTIAYRTASHEVKAGDLNLTAKNNGRIVFNDKIKGNSNVHKIKYEESMANGYTYTYYDSEGNIVKIVGYGDKQPDMEEIATWGYDLDNYRINIDGDSTGIVQINNNVEAVSDIKDVPAQADITLSNTQLHLGVRDNVLDGNNLTLNSGTFNMINGQAGVSAINNLTIKGNTNFVADVDLEKSEMDRFTAAEYGKHSGNLNVVGFNLVSDAPADRDVTTIMFAEKGLKDNVTHSPMNLPDSKVQQIFTPIYKYNSVYKNTDDGGYFVFAKGHVLLDPDNPQNPIPGGTTGNKSDAFNPAVLVSPVTTQAAGQSAMNEAFRYVFEHADAFTQLPSVDRFAAINENKYAIASTDYNQNLSYSSTDLHNKGSWVRPYTSFESINLSNGPKVNAINYGTLVGFDSDFKKLKNGWTNVATGYMGYNGSQIRYNGNDTTMNGGLLGLTETFYKGNFWTALTATAGAGVAESRTMYGKEDSTMLMAGLGSKTGYNFEFKEGKYILQPIMFLSYTFVNTFDYTNAAGVRINSDPMHTIQLNPSLRFITNTKNGWQPYASVGMVWNLMNETSATANGVKLPEMHTKPYVEYGVGIQKRMKDKFTAFGQAMIRNGGRNGIALTAGFRWALGREGAPINKQEKVNAPSSNKISSVSTDKKILKQLTPAQKTILASKSKNSSRTNNIALYKQL